MQLSALRFEPAPPSRSNAFLRDYYLNLGLNPDNPSEALFDTAGRSIAGARIINRISEATRPGVGAGGRILFNPDEMNDAVALRTGSGSPNDFAGGGTNYYVGSGYKPLVTAALRRQEDDERTNVIRNSNGGFDPRYTSPEQYAQQKFVNQRAVDTAYSARQQELKNRALSQGQRLNPSRFHFNAGGVMTRGDQTTTVPAGIGDSSQYVTPPAVGMITRDGVTHAYPRQSAPSFVPPPDPNVIDQRKPDDWISPRTKSLNGGY